VVIQPHDEDPDDDDTHEPSCDQVNRTLLNQFCFGNGRLVSIETTAFSGGVQVAQSRIWGLAGQLVASSLEFEGIDPLSFSSDSAALLDLGFVPLIQEATIGWQPLPGFPYPLRLPVTHPAYPCAPGSAEDLNEARTLARQRILYDDPRLLTAPLTLISSSGTSWGVNLAGALFQVKGSATAYLVVQTISPTSLVLSHAYTGPTTASQTYALNSDSSGQFYDHLLQLVSRDSSGGAMTDRLLPSPVVTAGTASVSQGEATLRGVPLRGAQPWWG
jgi:hypothetical protein